MRYFLALLAVLAFAGRPAFGWSECGHHIIAVMTYGRLPEAKQKELLEILCHHPQYETEFQVPEYVKNKERMDLYSLNAGDIESQFGAERSDRFVKQPGIKEWIRESRSLAKTYVYSPKMVSAISETCRAIKQGANDAELPKFNLAEHVSRDDDAADYSNEPGYLAGAGIVANVRAHMAAERLAAILDN